MTGLRTPSRRGLNGGKGREGRTGMRKLFVNGS